jgi:hypothetical protein
MLRKRIIRNLHFVEIFFEKLKKKKRKELIKEKDMKKNCKK